MNTLRSLMSGILVLLALITVPVTAKAAISSAIDPDLVGFWHMDGDWGDSSVNGNHGVGNKGAAFSTNRKVGNYAGSFDGVDDYVSVPDADSLDITDKITIEAWIYPKADFSGYAVHLINKWGLETTTANYVLYYFGTTSGINRQIGFYSNAGNVWKPISPRYTVSLNNWYHVVLSYSSAEGGYLYVNGVSQGPPVGSGLLKTNSYPLRFGSSRDGSGTVFGLIDEVAIYKRALTAEEIAVNYAAGFPPAPPVLGPVHSAVGTDTIALTGTSALNTSIWVNNKMVAVTDASGNWSGTYGSLQPGTNVLTVTALDSSNRLSEPVTVNVLCDTTPPVVEATPAGGIYSSAQSVALAVNEQAAIYYTMDGSTPTASATVYSHPIAIPAGATLKYFARDLAGNNSEIRTENYVIDTTSPVLAISTLSDGAYTNNEILNIAGTVMDDTGVTGITVNDTAVPVNAEGGFSYALLLKNGINMITIVTKDNAGNTAVDTRTITLDQTAPALIIATPADNSKTASALITVSGSVDETSSVLVTLGDSVQFAAQTGSAFSADVTLVPGYNTIEITAADLAGNRSSQKRTILYDDQKPSLAITEPNQDLRTNQGSLTIRGTASDPLTTVSVTVVVDGQTFVPQLLNGLFEQAVTFSEEKSHSIIVTATNEVETITSVQRNVIYDITPPSLGIDPIASPTSQPSLSVTGTREAGTAVAVTCITAAVGEVLYPTATTWLADISGLREGENVIAAASTDAAGNVVTAKGTVVLATRPPEITITATPDVIWQPNRRMVPVTIAGGVETHGSDIKSVLISVSDEYGKFEYSNLTFGSIVMLEAWRNGNDADGRKYTITAVVTDKGGVTTAKKATVTVPHSQNQDQTQKRQGFQLNKHKSKGVSPSGRARGNK